MNVWAKQKLNGFTIVELLIVIVVIGILAAITIVAFNGVQQRANTTTVVDGAAKTKRLVEAYVAANSSYPSTSPDFLCITTESTCRRNSSAMASSAATTALDTALRTIGTPVKSVSLATDIRGGITYNYDAARTVGGVSAPAILSYYLTGANTNCGMAVLTSEGTSADVASVPYTIGNVGSSNTTQCVVSIQGPRV